MATLREADAEAVAELVARGYAPLAARVLAARALTRPELLEPDIHKIDVAADSTTDRAAKAIVAAIAAGRRICVCGDFDADGVCAIALMKLGLEALGADCAYLVASHAHAERSLDPQMIRQAHELGAKLVVTVDCGSGAHAAVALAKELGIEVIVTDHHLVAEPVAADYLVNCHLPASGIPCNSICGAAIALVLLKATYRRSGARLRASRYLDLAAVATLGDMMPLGEECNRALVTEGLALIAKGRCRPLFTAILQDGRAASCTSATVSYKITPLLNCAHRMGRPELAVEALLAADISAARRHLSELGALNRERRLMQQRMVREAAAKVAHPVAGAVVVEDASWKPGMLGLVANELAARFKVPAAVLCPKQGGRRCSVRTARGISVHQVLAQLAAERPGLLAGFGGHHGAGGCTLEPGEGRLAEFAEHFARLCAQSEERPAVRLIDARPSAADLTAEAIAQLESIPWGADQPAPLFANDFRVARTRAISSGHMHDLELDGTTFSAWYPRDLATLGERVALEFQAVSSAKGPPLLMVKEASGA